MERITAIVLSRDRPAQLDLLLRSIDLNAPGVFDVEILFRASASPCYLFTPEDPWVQVMSGRSGWPEFWFERDLRMLLDRAGEYTCFMCDDGILYRPVESPPLPADNELCFSLRLGENTIRRYPSDTPQGYPGVQPWNWLSIDADSSDFGYPGSLDGHVFRTADLRDMLSNHSFPNPTALECALQEACEDYADMSGKDASLMRSFEQSVYVGNPVNRVSQQSGVRYGQRFPAPAAELAERFATGDRLDLELMDFSEVDGAHAEVELRWASERVEASV